MRAVLASIKPIWAEKIYSGEKTIEVRKTSPCPEDGYWSRHLTVYLYESGTGLVTGELEMSGVEQCTTPWFIGDTCLTDVQLREYGPGRDGWYRGWIIVSAKRYNAPKKLSDFRKMCTNDLYCESCGMYNAYTDRCGNAALAITRPPQSWCYVEDMCYG